MKKVKILLSAVAVFAIIGGIAAVKAQPQQRVFVTSKTAGVCDVTIPATLQNANQGLIGNFSATLVAGPCSAKNVYNPL